MASKKLGREQEDRVQKAVDVDMGGVLLRIDVNRFNMPRSSMSHLLSEKNIFGLTKSLNVCTVLEGKGRGDPSQYLLF